MRPTSTRPRSACAEHTETYDRIGDVPAWAHDLERRWQEEEARARVLVSPEESILDRVGAHEACRRRSPGNSSPSPGSG